MSLLDSVLEVRDASKSAGSGGKYLNPSQIEKDQTIRITILEPPTGQKSLGGDECWVTKEGKRFSMKFKTEPTRDDLKERADEESVELTGDETSKNFFAFWVWNYKEECVQVFQFSQQGLIDPIISNLSDEEISQEPWAFDFKISTNGLSGLDKRYNVACVPGKRRPEKINKQVHDAFDEVMNQGADLSNLLVGADPFKELAPF